MYRTKVLTLFAATLFSGLMHADAATLVHHWKLDETTGPVADSAGANPGTVLSAATLGASGPAGFGNAVSLPGDGTNGGIYVGDLAIDANNLRTNFTVAAWINPAAFSGDERGILTSSPLAGFSGTGWGFSQARGRLHFAQYGIPGADYFSDLNVITADTWQHVAVTVSPTTATFYLNGNAVGTAAVNPLANDTTQQFAIGRGVVGGYNPTAFNGLIDDVRLYSGVLTQPEVAALMTVPEPSSLALVAMAGCALLGGRRRRGVSVR